MATEIKERLNIDLTSKAGNYDGKVLQSKVIKTIPDLEKFIDYYCKTDTVSVDLDYLVNCDLVRIFFYDEHEWLAGYAINSSERIRYFDIFSIYEKGLILRDKGLREIDMVEISTIWISVSLNRFDKNARIEIYLKSIKDAYETNKPIIVGGSKKMTVWQNFEKILTREMYFGKIIFEKDKTVICKIVYEKREKAMLNFLQYLLEHSILSLLVA